MLKRCNIWLWSTCLACLLSMCMQCSPDNPRDPVVNATITCTRRFDWLLCLRSRDLMEVVQLYMESHTKTLECEWLLKRCSSHYKLFNLSLNIGYIKIVFLFFHAKKMHMDQPPKSILHIERNKLLTFFKLAWDLNTSFREVWFSKICSHFL